ncbi:MAG: enoyl-CoA hydratase-related protein [Alphaproteobacteria bacterium]
MYEDILYEVKDPVAVITFNRPESLNAASDRMLAELRHAVAAAEDDKRVVGIIITGAGRGFCSGRDVSGMGGGRGRSRPEGDGSLPAEPGDPWVGQDYQKSFTYLATVRKPVIAAVNGPCAGLGFVIAMMCDMRFIADNAFYMTAFSQRGLVAEHGLSWLLPRLIGLSRALEILWTSRRVKADEAERIGLADRVVEADKLLDECAAFIQSMAETVAPYSLQVMKGQLYRHLTTDYGTALEESWQAMADASAGPDVKEGVASFREKRPPDFGRVGKSN